MLYVALDFKVQMPPSSKLPVIVESGEIPGKNAVFNHQSFYVPLEKS